MNEEYFDLDHDTDGHPIRHMGQNLDKDDCLLLLNRMFNETAELKARIAALESPDILKPGDRVNVQGADAYSCSYSATFQRWGEELIRVDGENYCITVAIILLDNNEIETVRPSSLDTDP